MRRFWPRSTLAAARPASELSEYAPARVLEVELSRPIPQVSSRDPRTNRDYRRAVSLIRLHTYPLGMVRLDLVRDGLTAGEHARLIWARLGSAIVSHLQQDNLPIPSRPDESGVPGDGTPRCLLGRAEALANPPLVSVVVSTRDRADELPACLDSILAMRYPRFEVVVVDNAPSTEATACLIRSAYGHDPRVRYVREDQPGLSIARNRGALEAAGDIVAMTDDDVVVDPDWVTTVVAGFRSAENVGCVTGLVVPKEIETPVQALVEAFWGYGKGFQRRIYDLTEHRERSPLYPFDAGRFGSGMNMAFRATVLRELGGFDTALGAGAPAMAGEDLAHFFRTIRGGYAIVYEPSALVRHRHDKDYDGLIRKAFGYGSGLSAYLTKIVADEPPLLLQLVARLPAGLPLLLKPQTRNNRQRSSRYPADIIWAERLGMLYGPPAYLRGRLRWPRWTVHSLSGTGRVLDTGRVLARAVKRLIAWVTHRRRLPIVASIVAGVILATAYGLLLLNEASLSGSRGRGESAAVPATPGAVLPTPSVVLGGEPAVVVAEPPRSLPPSQPRPVGQDGEWHLVFDDEFEAAVLDPEKWATCYWWATSGCTNAGNNELQWYEPGNVRIVDGSLRLVAEKRPAVGVNGKVFEYTSGMVTTGRMYAERHLPASFAAPSAYAEIRARIPAGRGLWPVFWLLPSDRGDSPEIDVMEFVGQDPSTIYLHYHHRAPTVDGRVPDRPWISQGGPWSGPDFSADWHTFAAEWNAEEVVWYVDGAQRLRAARADSHPGPMYLLLNLAVGGNWPGPPDDTTPFPAEFAVDYLRVWVRAESGR